MSEAADEKYAVGFLLTRASAGFSNLLGAQLQARGLDITPEQWSVLDALWERKGINQQGLAGCLSKNKTSISRIVDGLEKKGLVERCANPEDRRDKILLLSDEGVALRNRGAKLHRRVIDQAMDGISDADQAVLARVLRGIHENTTADRPD